jgi:site-specific DNA recombinase
MSDMISTRESRPYSNTHLKDRELVVGYARVSSTRQGSEKGFGLATQKKAIMDYCAANSLTVYDIFTDIVSGTEASFDERQAYWEMLEYAKKAGVRTVVVLDLSRLFRDPAACVLIRKNFSSQNLDVRSINQPTYSLHSENDPSEYLVNSLLESLSHYERLTTISKLKAGRHQKASEGRYSGSGISTGIKIVNREAVIDEREMEIVKFIFKLRKKKRSLYSIAQTLNKQNIKGKKGGSWTHTSVKRILQNKLYKGWLKHGKVYYKSQLGKLI